MPITWYVNLDADPRHHRGPEIPLKVTRSVFSGYNPHRSVSWTCTPNADNLNTVAADASWMQGDAPNTQFSTVAEHAQSREFHNRLQLPPYGNESYTVTAQRSDQTGASLTEQFDIRRRIYYLANWMNAEGERLLAIVEPIVTRIFAELGIELKRVGRSAIPNRADIVDLQPLVATRPVPPRDKVGLMMRLALIQMAFGEREQTTRLPVVDQNGIAIAGADTVVDDNGVWQITVHLPPEPNVPVHRRLRLGAEPKVNVGIAQYTDLGHVIRNRDTGWFDSERSLPCTVVRVDDRTVRLRIRDEARTNNANLTRLADLYREARLANNFAHPHFTGTPAAPTLEFAVKITALRPLGGFSSGPNISLTQDMSQYYAGATRQRIGEALARVFAHEIAHSIAMVMDTHDYNGAQNAHPNWYDDINGGTGSHCHLNATLVNNDAQTAGEFFNPDNPNCVQVYTPDDHTICIMFHQRTNHLHRLEFCDDCKEFMRAQDLSRDNLRAVRSWHQLY